MSLSDHHNFQWYKPSISILFSSYSAAQGITVSMKITIIEVWWRYYKNFTICIQSRGTGACSSLLSAGIMTYSYGHFRVQTNILWPGWLAGWLHYKCSFAPQQHHSNSSSPSVAQCAPAPPQPKHETFCLLSQIDIVGILQPRLDWNYFKRVNTQHSTEQISQSEV